MWYTYSADATKGCDVLAPIARPYSQLPICATIELLIANLFTRRYRTDRAPCTPVSLDPINRTASEISGKRSRDRADGAHYSPISVEPYKPDRLQIFSGGKLSGQGRCNKELVLREARFVFAGWCDRFSALAFFLDN